MLLASLGHAPGGWPLPRGGSGAIVAALEDDLRAHGGDVVTGHRVGSLEDLPRARAYVFDTAPRVVADVFADRLPPRAEGALRRFRHGDAAAKVDLVLSGPVPGPTPRWGARGPCTSAGRAPRWRAARPTSRRAATRPGPWCS